MRRSERGAATAELVVAVPLLLLLLMTIVQFALWQHANHVANAAAEEAVRVTRTQAGTTSAGQMEATNFLNQLADGLVLDPRVEVSRDAVTARAEISGTTEGVVPYLRLPVHAKSESPIERFVGVEGSS